MTEAEQIEQQAETIKALWHEISRLRRRVEAQQYIIDDLRSQLHEATDPFARAEAVFQNEGQ